MGDKTDMRKGTKRKMTIAKKICLVVGFIVSFGLIATCYCIPAMILPICGDGVIVFLLVVFGSVVGCVAMGLVGCWCAYLLGWYEECSPCSCHSSGSYLYGNSGRSLGDFYGDYIESAPQRAAWGAASMTAIRGMHR